jgi:hypothetical protein
VHFTRYVTQVSGLICGVRGSAARPAPWRV